MGRTLRSHSQRCCFGCYVAFDRPRLPRSSSTHRRALCTRRRQRRVGARAGAEARRAMEQAGRGENRSGGNTLIATEYVGRQPADGYTILMVTTVFAVNPSLLQKLPYDTFKNFAPVVLAGSAPNVLVTKPSLPVNSVKELIAYGHANPGKLTYGHPGIGTTPHLAVELFNSDANIKAVGVDVSRHAAAARSDAGRRDRLRVRRHQFAQPGTGRQAEGPRRHRRAPARTVSRDADDDRSRAAGLRSLHLVRLCRAGRHAAGRDSRDQPGYEQGHAGSRPCARAWTISASILWAAHRRTSRGTSAPRWTNGARSSARPASSRRPEPDNRGTP